MKHSQGETDHAATATKAKSMNDMNDHIGHNHITSRPSKSIGQTGIPIITAVGAIFALFLPWNAWLSARSVAQGEALSAITQWQNDTTKKIDYLIEATGANPTQIVRANSATTTEAHVLP